MPTVCRSGDPCALLCASKPFSPRLTRECAAVSSLCVCSSPSCTIFLAYTSNLVSSGLRETLRFLVQHKMVDVLVATAGGIEEDLIKCLAPTMVGREVEMRARLAATVCVLRADRAGCCRSSAECSGIVVCVGVQVGDFSLPGRELRRRGINRIGNLLVPNDNYCKFEDWVMPILHKMADEQVCERLHGSASS